MTPSAENDAPAEAVTDPDTSIVYFPDDDAPDPHDAHWERGYRDAIADLQADYPYGDMPEWRARGVDWLSDRLAERRVIPSEGDTGREDAAPRWGVCIQVGHNYAPHEETDHCLVFVPQSRVTPARKGRR